MASAHASCPSSTQRDHLIALLARDEVDDAIEAGLMDFVPCAAPCCRETAAPLLHMQDKLRAAWAARDRYRARTQRLQGRAAERDARRAIPPASAVADVRTPALPASAAAILARAKAKAAGQPTD